VTRLDIAFVMLGMSLGWTLRSLLGPWMEQK